MARKSVTSQGYTVWAMNECEERLLIAFYLKVKGRLSHAPKWNVNFEYYFFTAGERVSGQYLDSMNDILRRSDLKPFLIQETDAGEYARNADRTAKTSQRMMWVTEYQGLTDIGRARWERENEAEMSALAPPHVTWEDYNKRRTERPILHLDPERARRVAALRVASEVSPVTLTEPVAVLPAEPVVVAEGNLRIQRQLALAVTEDNDEMLVRIVDKLDADTALELAEKAEKGTLRTMLLERSLRI